MKKQVKWFNHQSELLVTELKLDRGFSAFSVVAFLNPANWKNLQKGPILTDSTDAVGKEKIIANLNIFLAQ